MKRASLPFTAASMTVCSVDDEQERVIVVLVVIFVTRIRGGVRNAVTEVFENARALRRSSATANTPRPCTSELRTSTSGEVGMGGPPRLGCDWSKRPSLFFLRLVGHTATGALMAGWCW